MCSMRFIACNYFAIKAIFVICPSHYFFPTQCTITSPDPLQYLLEGPSQSKD